MESESQSGRNLSCSALNPHFKKAVQSVGENSEKRHSCRKRQAQKNNVSEKVLQELSEKKMLKLVNHSSYA